MADFSSAVTLTLVTCCLLVLQVQAQHDHGSGCVTSPPTCGPGTCTPIIPAPYYSCACPPGYTGTTCGTTEEGTSAEPTPSFMTKSGMIGCVFFPSTCNKGICTSTENYPYFSCACTPGYTGPTCDVLDDNGGETSTIGGPPKPDPTANDNTMLMSGCVTSPPTCGLGTCTPTESAPYFSCACPPGRTGTTCNELDEETSTPLNQAPIATTPESGESTTGLDESHYPHHHHHHHRNHDYEYTEEYYNYSYQLWEAFWVKFWNYVRQVFYGMN